MKNVLFATTALIATAGIASADVKVGGYGFMGVIFDGSTSTTSVSHKMRLTFSGSVETDSGVSFTASSRMNISNSAKDAAANALERGKITMTSGGLTLTVGATNGAMKSAARIATFHGFDDGSLLYAAGGPGVDSNVSTQNDGGNNVLISYASGDFTVRASTDVNGNNQEVGASYSFNNMTISAGADTASAWMLGVKYNGGNFNLGLGTNSNSDIVLTAGYDISDATSIGFGLDAASGGTINAVGLQVAHDLGGATLTGAVGQVNGSDTVASLGVQFSF